MDYRDHLVSPAEAVSGIRRGGFVSVGSAAAEPQALTRALAERAHLLSDNQVIHIRSLGVSAYAEPRFRDNIRYNTFFIGESVRSAVAGGSADYTPIFLSDRSERIGWSPRPGSAYRDALGWANNPLFEFHPSDYSNDPFVISQNSNMTAINAALEVDLTGQVCSDSLGTALYSGFGGQVDFIRGAARARGGRAIIALPSTAVIDGQRVSRIVSVLKPGAGVVTTRADVHFVVTEYGSADLFGRSVRERAIALIHLAHPDFREGLLREARERRFVYEDQIAVPGAGAAENQALASECVAHNGSRVLIRPIIPADEELLQDLFYRSSKESIYLRFLSSKTSLHHRDAQYLVNVDYHDSLALVGLVLEGEREVIIAVGRYYRSGPAADSADSAFFVRDDWQAQGVGHFLVERLMQLAAAQGIDRFTADVLISNTAMLHLFHECARGPVESTMDGASYHLSFPITPAPSRL